MIKYLCKSCKKSDWQYDIPENKTAPVHPRVSITWWSVCPGSGQPLIQRDEGNDGILVRPTVGYYFDSRKTGNV